MKLLTILKEHVKKLKEDMLGSKYDYKNFLYSIQNDNMSDNIYILNDTTYLTNTYEVTLGLSNIIALYSNITNIPKESILLKKNQKIKLYDGYVLFDANCRSGSCADIKKTIPEFNPVQGKYFVLEILNDKNYTKIDSTYVIDIKNFIKLFDYLNKYDKKIDNNLLNNITNSLNKYNEKTIDDLISNDDTNVMNGGMNKQNTNNDETYEKLNTKYKYNRKNVGKVILTKFDKFWGKFAPKNFLIYNNSQYKPIDVDTFINVSKNEDKTKYLNFYGLSNNNRTTFYRLFNNNKPNYKEDKIFAVIIQGSIHKDSFSKKETYIMNFIFDLIIEKNTNNDKKYYSVPYINTIQFDTPYKITSYKDFININKEILRTIKETTNEIINNEL